MDEGDVAVDEGRQLRAVGDDLLVGDDIGGVVGGAEGGLAVQIPGDEHAGGQLGRVDLVLVDEAVAHIGRAVRRDKAQLACRMAGERQYTEPGAVYVDVVLLGEDDPVGGEALLQKQLTAFAVGQGHVVGAVAVRVHRDTGFDQGDGGFRAVSLLQIPDVAGVVEVGVGAENGAQTPAAAVDERGQAGSVQLGVAGVDEHHIPVIELINGQQGGGGDGRICIAQHVQKFHENQPPEKCFPHYTPPVGKNKAFRFASCAAGAGHAGECGGICKKEFRKIFDFPPMQNGRNKVKYLIEN